MSKITFFDVNIDSLNMKDSVDLISKRLTEKKFTQHVVVNVAKLVNMRNDTELAQSVTGCDIINIDGMGVVWGARFLGHDVPERVAGVDLFHNLNAMAQSQRFPVFYLGAKQEVVE